MDLTYFQTFVEVARKRSITRAAEELGYAQSSVTTQIQKLEREYGVPLFERFGGRLRLTPPGEELLKITVRMLELYSQSKETVASHAGGGTLAIGTIDSLASYYLPPLLQQLRGRFPDLRILLQPETESSVIAGVKDGELDIGFVLDDKPSDPSLRWITIREEPLVLVARPDHPLAMRTKIGLPDLGNEEFIAAEESCNYRVMFERVLKAEGAACRNRFELGNPEAIKQCVKSGLGIALLPRIVVEDAAARGELAVLSFSHPEIKFDLQAVIHPKKWLSQPLLALLALVGAEPPT